MQLLRDKVVFLTGGSSGIGLECARKYKSSGAKVFVMANDMPSLERVADELGGENRVFYGDVSVSGDVEKAIQAAMALYGQVDVIHNNAGIAHPSVPLHETTDEQWQQLFDVNLKSVLHTCRFGLEALKKTQGCIVNTSSLVGQIGQHDHAAYVASKGAMNALTKSMAIDYAVYKIRVNAVAPAGVWTDMLRKWANEQRDTGRIEQYLDEIHLLGYCPEGDTVADACVFLASDMARFITGCILPVGGGAELGYRRG